MSKNGKSSIANSDALAVMKLYIASTKDVDSISVFADWSGKLGPKAAATVAENNPLCRHHVRPRTCGQGKELTKMTILLASWFQASIIVSSSFRDISRYKVNIASEPSILESIASVCTQSGG